MTSSLGLIPFPCELVKMNFCRRSTRREGNGSSVVAVIALGALCFSATVGCPDNSDRHSPKTEKDSHGSDSKGTSSPTSRMVNRAGFSGVWPLTVDSGVLHNFKLAEEIEVDGKLYQRNGTASSRGFTRADPIWADNPDIPGARFDISPLIEAALKLQSSDP